MNFYQFTSTEIPFLSFRSFYLPRSVTTYQLLSCRVARLRLNGNHLRRIRSELNSILVPINKKRWNIFFFQKSMLLNLVRRYRSMISDEFVLSVDNLRLQSSINQISFDTLIREIRKNFTEKSRFGKVGIFEYM